jgi:hypothetical protein
VHQEEARAVAKQAAAPGVGWLLALAFAQLQVTTRRARERRGGASCSAEASAYQERRDLRAALAGDKAWRRAVGAHLRGHCGDAEERVNCMSDRAAVASERARRASMAQAARAWLQHWGVSGPLSRGCAGVAALGTPALGDVGADARPVFRLVISPVAPRTSRSKGRMRERGSRQAGGARSRRAPTEGRGQKGAGGSSQVNWQRPRMDPAVLTFLNSREEERKLPRVTPEYLAAWRERVGAARFAAMTKARRFIVVERPGAGGRRGLPGWKGVWCGRETRSWGASGPPVMEGRLVTGHARRGILPRLGRHVGRLERGAFRITCARGEGRTCRR